MLYDQLQAPPGQVVNILLSAYACEPGKGSEPGVGWRWAIELAQLGHRVWVITRANNRELIEAEQSNRASGNLQFIYYDLPAWACYWKKGARGVHLYYLLWQVGALRVARRLTQHTRFDRVHHITFGVFRHPSFMAFLGIPFVFGPIGGGESTPQALRKGYPLRGRLADLIRDISNLMARLDPFVHATFARSTLILCRTRETLSIVPARHKKKCQILSDIGIEMPTFKSEREEGLATNAPVPCRGSNFRLLYVGRLLYWKGIHLGLRALARLRDKVPEARLTIVGSGPEERWLQDLASSLGIAEAIDWIPWIPQIEVLKLYSQHQIFLFPSLHDSGGTVVLEALSYGLPVVCLDLGGPGAIVDDSCGQVVSTAGCSEEEVVALLEKKLELLVNDSETYRKCVLGASTRAAQYQWSKLISCVYTPAEL